jgi:hypothetical protein
MWSVAKAEADANVKDVEVKSGDTIDFVVDCGAAAHGDEFTWAPTIRLVPNATDRPEIISSSAKEFRGPNPRKLLAWEQLALVILQSNELVFVD